MTPKVSIVVGCYNQRKYVREAMESVLSQTYPDIEIIAKDNGSTDGTADMLKRYAGDKRVRLLIRPVNGPLTTFMNEAVRLCSGDFISILNGDDYYLPEKIERQVECFSHLSSEYGVVYGPNYRLNDLTGERWLDPCLKESGHILRDMLLKHHTAGPINFIIPLIRKECFLRYPFREELFTEGEAIFLRMAMRYNFRYIDEPLAVMRDHLSNMGKALRNNRAWVVPTLEQLGREPEFPKDALPALNRYRGRIFRNYGWQGIRVMEDPAWARECYALALRYDPQQFLHPRTLAGLAISTLPHTLINALNRAVNRLRRHKGNVVFKNDYS